METKTAHRYLIIPFEINWAKQVILIDRKIADHFIGCDGLMITVVDFLNTGCDIQHIGEISLTLNSGQVHPIHLTAGFSTQPLKKDNTFLPLNETVLSNTHLEGFFEDAGTAKDEKGRFIPYHVNVYLKCIKRV